MTDNNTQEKIWHTLTREATAEELGANPASGLSGPEVE